MKLKTPLGPIFDSQKGEPKSPSWMVVDDNQDLLDSVGIMLERLERAEIYKFRSAEEALNCFALYPNEFELIITDFGLPGLNGLELCSRMRQISPSVKIILSTGNAITHETFAKNAGFNGVLQKPYGANALWQVVLSTLSEKDR